MKKKKKFRVNYGGYKDGPKFTSISEALAFVRHVLKNEAMHPVTIVPIEDE